MDKPLDFSRVDQVVTELKELASKAFQQGQSMDKTELSIFHKLMSMGHALVGSIIERAGDGDVGPSAEKNGRQFKQLPKRKRRYRSIFGEFQIERYVYGTSPEQAIQIIPLDEHLGLPDNDYSLVLEVWTGILATDSSFHSAVKSLERITSIHVPIDSAERIESRLGKSAASVLDNPPSIDDESEAEILVQTSDNKGIPMVRKNTERRPVGAPENRMGPKPNQKQMACMAGVFSVDRNVRNAQEIVDALFRDTTKQEKSGADAKRVNPRYFASLTKHDKDGNQIGKAAEEQAQQWLTTNTLRRHREGQEILIMHDGQRSLWNLSRAYQQGWNVIEILDLLHALQRLWSAAKIIKPDSEVESYVKTLLWQLLSGGVGLMITWFRSALKQKGMTKANKTDLEKVINFMEANRTRMKYDEYLAKGYPIATGYIEGACRHVIKDRMERSGMRWKEKGAQAMLNLRCIDSSELWNVMAEKHQVTSLVKYGKERRNFSEAFLTMAS